MMNSLLRYRLCPFFILLFLCSYQASATHFRAGEITARKISSLTYEVKLTAYFDVSPRGKPAADAATQVNFYFGVPGPNTTKTLKVVQRDPSSVRNIGLNTTVNEYVTTYTFPSAAAYEISVEMDNRNEGTLNINNGINTQSINFFVHSILLINSSIGSNQTPVLLNAPIDLAAVGQRYIHNPGAFDADGDSLSYKLYVPQQSLGGGVGRDVVYKDPTQVTPPGATEAGASPATFNMNPITGDLTWDAPVTAGQYNVAFVVEEWRDGVRIGQIIRDMQILVEDARNDRPLLDPLADICVEAGTRISQLIRATDKNGDRLTLTSNGGVYESTLVAPAVATFTPQTNAIGTVTGQFVWQTGCNHIRLEPYDVLFKVEDAAGPSVPNPSLFRKLVDITTMN
ncbi:gliding motility-associated C-terminal domain-containing protein, partial [Dyadobacter psychrotolerans]